MLQRKQNSKIPILFIIGGGLLLIAIGITLGSQNTSTVPTPAAVYEEAADAAILRVSLVEAKAAHDSGSAIFLDVRSPDAYQLDHIAGAINIPLGAIESRISELDAEQWIITYCT